jgi:hypothetical protein
MEVFLENVRCLCGKHNIPLEPLTLLVGENSTGKSTFLAMLEYVSQSDFASLRPSFNSPPFDLGAYDSIATYKGGKYGRADSFSIGAAENGAEDGTRKIMATYRSHRGQPQLFRYEASTSTLRVALDMQDWPSAKVTIEAEGAAAKTFSLDAKEMEAGMPVSFLLHRIVAEVPDMPTSKILRLTGGFRQGPSLPALALAPIRTKPRRTYDEYYDNFMPEGDHIPVMLARVWQEEREKGSLFETLNAFGRTSSLFKHIRVRPLGKGPTDPFQILVTTAGPPANLSDVGYGVSQALPVAVQSVVTRRSRLLIQQPEVHLHPRGQAELGSFFARLVTRGRKEFVIETHSDYLLDRIRVEVAKGTVPPSDVLILFFEKDGLETRVHQIHLDSSGNVSNAPASYRRFFLEEEASLFSRAVS